MKFITIAFLRFITGARAQWRGCLPARQQRVYFANHTSHLDAVILWSALPGELRARTRPVAAKDYWCANKLRFWIASKILGAVLIERQKVAVHNNPMHDLVDALKAGDSLIIFPEGTRSAGPEPKEFKSGLFHLIKENLPVEFVPVYLENLNRILPKGEILPVPLIGSVIIGEPIVLNPGEPKKTFLDRARLAVWNLHTA